MYERSHGYRSRSAGVVGLMPELRKVRQARRRRDRAEEELRAAVLAARAAGASLQSIADAAGITRQRVWQIERETR